MTFTPTDTDIPTSLNTSRQMILVLAEHWDDFQARLYLCEKNNGNWQVVEEFPAVCGRQGMAWGLGIWPASPASQLQPAKKEGDQKTPVGIFDLGVCMGYAPELAANPQWPYQPLTDTMQGVDDPDSQFYNQVVETASLQEKAATDWDSFEVMRRNDNLYKWLLVIGHNPANLPGAGSLIFMHLWEHAGKGTAGCTAVAEESMTRILTWLDLEGHPILVQLPREIYPLKVAEWGLPSC